MTINIKMKLFAKMNSQMELSLKFNAAQGEQVQN